MMSQAVNAADSGHLNLLPQAYFPSFFFLLLHNATLWWNFSFMAGNCMCGWTKSLIISPKTGIFCCPWGTKWGCTYRGHYKHKEFASWYFVCSSCSARFFFLPVSVGLLFLVIFTIVYDIVWLAQAFSFPNRGSMHLRGYCQLQMRKVKL